MENSFNLLEEPWIPVVDSGFAPLEEVFRDRSLREIGGNPVQKIVLMKLLLAVAQRAVTPQDNSEWDSLGAEGLRDAVLRYLDDHRDDFWFYGDKPFLQVPEIRAAQRTNYGALTPEIASGNATVLFSSQIGSELTDAEKALLVLQVNAMALSGKQVDNSVVLSSGYTEKSNAKGNPSSGRVGPSLGHFGYQHSYYIGESISETVYMNLLTIADLEATGMFPEGVGVPPWEEPPHGEDDVVAKRLRSSYIGRLIPMSRFLLDSPEGGLHYSEGVHHPNHNEGVWDPSASIQFKNEKSRAIWIDPNKRPWRQLPAILAFMTGQEEFVTFQIKLPYQRIVQAFSQIGLWVGGLRVSNNAGERYCAGTDDYVESSFSLETSYLGESWYTQLSLELQELGRLEKNLWGAITGYYRQLKVENKDRVRLAVTSFWQSCEQHFTGLVNSCAPGETTQPVRKQFLRHMYHVYDTNCPRDSARQMEAWAASRPRIGNYLERDTTPKEEAIDQ